MKNEKFKKFPIFFNFEINKKKIIIAVFDSYMYYLLFIIKINPNKCVIEMFIDLLIQKKNILFNKNLCSTSNVLLRNL